MNEQTCLATTAQESTPEHQVTRFRELLEKVNSCCQSKSSYLSEKFAIPPAEIKALTLFRGERYLTVTGITSKLDVTKSRVTKILQGLLDKGLVEAMEDPRDARVKLVSLTPKGRESVEKIEAFTLNMHRSVLDNLRFEDRNLVLTCLSQLWDSMEEVKKELRG